MSALHVIWTPADVKAAAQLARLYDAIPLLGGGVELAPVVDIRTREVIA